MPPIRRSTASRTQQISSQSPLLLDLDTSESDRKPIPKQSSSEEQGYSEPEALKAFRSQLIRQAEQEEQRKKSRNKAKGAISRSSSSRNLQGFVVDDDEDEECSGARRSRLSKQTRLAAAQSNGNGASQVLGRSTRSHKAASVVSHESNVDFVSWTKRIQKRPPRAMRSREEVSNKSDDSSEPARPAARAPRSNPPKRKRLSQRQSTTSRSTKRPKQRAVVEELPLPILAQPNVSTSAIILDIEPDPTIRALYEGPVDFDFPPQEDVESLSSDPEAGSAFEIASSASDFDVDANDVEMDQLDLSDSTEEEEEWDEDAVQYHQSELAMDRHWDTCKKCGDKPSATHWRAAVLAKFRMEERQKRQPRLQSPAKKTRSERTSYTTGMFDDGIVLDTPEQRLQEWMEALKGRAGWLQCAVCTTSFHWGCLNQPLQAAILANMNAERQARHRCLGEEGTPAPQHISVIGMHEVLDSFPCPDCSTARYTCTVCMADSEGNRVPEANGGPSSEVVARLHDPPAKLDSPCLFRCQRCFHCTHYECMEKDQPDQTVEEKAEAVQKKGWLCSDCHQWGQVDQILAWRQLDKREWTEARDKSYPAHNFKEDLKREYLVKFKDRSFRETVWVPHGWLNMVSSMLLSHFLRHGTRVELEPAELIESSRSLAEAKKGKALMALGGAVERPSRKGTESAQAVRKVVTIDGVGEVNLGPPRPEPDAQERIPTPWKTPDRILTVKYFASVEKYEDEPSGREIDVEDMRQTEVLDPLSFHESWPHVARMLVKWQDVGYEKATWEKLPSRRKHGDVFGDFQRAYKAYLASRQVSIPVLDADAKQVKDNRHKGAFRALDDQPTNLRDGELIDFQLEGVNWLRYGWHRHQPSILADEMGLGKTVQIIAFLGSLWTEYKAGPFLIVVPNSTLPNWVREFEKWLPQFRVVPYWGEQDARKTIDKYELFHHDGKEKTRRSVKAHVVVASEVAVRYDSLPLRKVGKWDVIIVDEGQSLKSGHSLLMKKLDEMQAEHRIIMTGTPLNNNIGELFNLLNWLEPCGQWSEIKELKKKYEVLTPELIDGLQPKLKPYFLRRIKSQVLDLPPKTELIVPTSLRPIQKRIYRSILENNIADIQALTEGKNDGKTKQKAKLTNLNNVLMQLRKCIQHPYLIAPDLEAKEGEAGYEASWEHQRLVDASAKLLLLQRLLPKLKERGHRVLLFSQFVINLDIVEVFLSGETYKYLRLDGTLGQKQRQKGIDAFNAPDSDYFIYMISTRAGGVGINLATADTVIIFDPDFNPHVDMQAIARAHRIGQTKKVLVFTLMCKSTAEEQIIESAKKKMVLDHLIVQNLNNDEDRPETLESVLKYGAQALFAEEGTEETDKDVRYTDEDLDALLDRGEKEDEDGGEGEAESGGKFSYARVWEKDQAAASNGDVIQIDDDFWADLLEKHRTEASRKTEAAEEENRAARRKRGAANIRAALRDNDKGAVERQVSGEKRPRGRPKGKTQPRTASQDRDANFVVRVNDNSSGKELVGQVPEDMRQIIQKRKEAKAAWKPRSKYLPFRMDITPSLLDLKDFDPSTAPENISAGEHAVFSNILLKLPPMDVAEVQRRFNADKPKALPAVTARHQLTMTHIDYFTKGLSMPKELFMATFTIVPEESIPADLRNLPYGGAVALSAPLIKELLLRTATFMLYAVRHKSGALKARAEVPATPKPSPVASSLQEAEKILSDPQLSRAWLDKIKQNRDSKVTKIAQQALTFPDRANQFRMLVDIERTYTLKQQQRNGQPSTSPAPFTGPSTQTDNEPVFVSQTMTGKMLSMPALARLSAAYPLAPGSPAKALVDSRELKIMSVTPKNQRKPRISNTPATPSATPQSPYFPPIPTMQAPPRQETSRANNRPVQRCIVCHEPFHFINRCPLMSDVHAASLRWHELVISSATDSSLHTTLKVMTLKLNTLRSEVRLPRLDLPENLLS